MSLFHFPRKISQQVLQVFQFSCYNQERPKVRRWGKSQWRRLETLNERRLSEQKEETIVNIPHQTLFLPSELNGRCIYFLNLVPPYGCRFKSASSSHLDYFHIQSYQIVSSGTDSLSLLKLQDVFHVKYASFWSFLVCWE